MFKMKSTLIKRFTIGLVLVLIAGVLVGCSTSPRPEIQNSDKQIQLQPGTNPNSPPQMVGKQPTAGTRSTTNPVSLLGRATPTRSWIPGKTTATTTRARSPAPPKVRPSTGKTLRVSTDHGNLSAPTMVYPHTIFRRSL